MEYIFLGMSVFVMTFASYMLGQAIAIGPLKRENERLNAELHKLTDRDERGRFRGGK